MPIMAKMVTMAPGARDDGGDEAVYTPDNSVKDGVIEAVDGTVGDDYCSEHTMMGDSDVGTISVEV